MFTNYNSTHNCSQDLNSLVSQSIVLEGRNKDEILGETTTADARSVNDATVERKEKWEYG